MLHLCEIVYVSLYLSDVVILGALLRVSVSPDNSNVNEGERQVFRCQADCPPAISCTVSY